MIFNPKLWCLVHPPKKKQGTFIANPVHTVDGVESGEKTTSDVKSPVKKQNLNYQPQLVLARFLNRTINGSEIITPKDSYGT